MTRAVSTHLSSVQQNGSFPSDAQYDAVLVGAGIMGATLAALLHELDPSLRLLMLERLEAPAFTGAVIRFSGWANAEKADEHWQKLREFLIKGGIEIVGEPTLNQYDPPWTLPFLRRNEIIVPVNRDGSEKESAVTELS